MLPTAHRPSSPRPSSSRIAATLIVRNEERCLARCLDSVAPFVDRMVVLDTGSTDGTVAIAKAAGAEVHHLAWPDDFAEARNHVLACADADWNLMLDADEWISAGGEDLRRWCSGPPRLGAVCIENSVDGSAHPTRSWLPRLLPRGAYYEGRVHEQVISSLPRANTPIHVGHDGYLSAQKARKIDRNYRLLERELAAQPDNPYLLFQLGMEAQARRDLPTACDYLERALATAPRDAGWRHPLVTSAMTLMTYMGRRDEALALADAEFPHWPQSPDYFYVLGDILFDRALADPAQAIGHWLPLAQVAWERCLAIGERPDLDGSVAGRGSYLAQQSLDIVRSQLATLAA
ncbi:TPR domain-containing glycosyltransferase [uncultured Sphingomonas sp.]|uniref:TPR domain-containing glycosyltransferase n=1 Tax=uncultured Sphingomonas sp. TaxID=158754 RepID=UPI0025FA2340|nr:TPR domain-containing glycosyltransferase [uncultured Sphingomonas sp.]